MKLKLFGILMFIFCSYISINVALGTEKVIENYPSAFLPETSYDFDPAIEGVEITHDFIIQNKGTAPLEIKNVKTGCSCTVAFYTEQIPAGGEGKLTIKINTNGYGGRKFKRTILVMTNDKKKPSLTLTISGPIDKFVTINPQFVRLEGLIGQPIVQAISIIPEKKHFFKILEAKPIQGKDIRLKLTENKEPKGTVYLLTVENIRKEKGRYFDTIELKTNSEIQPEIKISVYGHIFDKKQNP